LVQAVKLDQKGISGNLTRSLNSLVDDLPGPHFPVFEFQRLLANLFGDAGSTGEQPTAGQALYAAGALVATQAYLRPALRSYHNECLLDAMGEHWDALTGAESLADLKRELATAIPYMGIANAYVAYHPSSNPAKLAPLLYLRDGRDTSVASGEYETCRMLPEGLFREGSARRSLTILPLRYRSRRLGVAVFEFPEPLDLYSVLREHLNVALHGAMGNATR
jgi:hypothetical protein